MLPSKLPKEHWDAEEKGGIINQEYLAGTLMTFSVVVLEALEQVGIEEPLECQEAYLHAWNVVGYLLGVNEVLLPKTVAEGQYLIKRVIERNILPSEAGATLTKALIEFSKQRIPMEKLKISPEVVIRFLNSEEIVNALNVPAASGCLASIIPLSMKLFYGMVERLEEHSQPLHLLIDILSRTAVENMVNFFIVEKKRKFVIPKALIEHWNLYSV